jgi:hypothetical protein
MFVKGPARGAVGCAGQGCEPPQIDGFTAVQGTATAAAVQRRRAASTNSQFVGGMFHLCLGDCDPGLFRGHGIEIH